MSVAFDTSVRRIARASDLIRNAMVSRPAVTVGVEDIDAALPWGGLPRGLHEVAGPAGDAARTGFAVLLAGRRPGPILWCRARHVVMEEGASYGPGMRDFGIESDRLILVDASKQADLLWAVEEGARTKGIAAVLAEGAIPDLTASRRLQLAAEAGGGLVFVLAAGTPPQSSSALTRWRINSLPSLAEAGGPGRPRWNVALWRCRGGGRPQNWTVEYEDAALSVSLVSALADRPLAATG
jgi:protein ImuA